MAKKKKGSCKESAAPEPPPPVPEPGPPEPEVASPEPEVASPEPEVAPPEPEPTPPPSPSHSQTTVKRPKTSPYTSSPVALRIGPELRTYYVPEDLLQHLVSVDSYSSWNRSIQLSDVDESIGHVLAHYLYTGAYQTLDDTETPAEEANIEFKRAFLAYLAANKYCLLGLRQLAEQNMEYFGAEMSIFDIVDVIQEDFSRLPCDDPWICNYLDGKAKTAFEKDLTVFSTGTLFDHIADVSLAKFMAKCVVKLYNDKVSRMLDTEQELCARIARDCITDRRDSATEENQPEECCALDGTFPNECVTNVYDAPIEETQPKECCAVEELPAEECCASECPPDPPIEEYPSGEYITDAQDAAIEKPVATSDADDFSFCMSDEVPAEPALEPQDALAEDAPAPEPEDAPTEEHDAPNGDPPPEEPPPDVPEPLAEEPPAEEPPAGDPPPDVPEPPAEEAPLETNDWGFGFGNAHWKSPWFPVSTKEIKAEPASKPANQAPNLSPPIEDDWGSFGSVMSGKKKKKKKKAEKGLQSWSSPPPSPPPPPPPEPEVDTRIEIEDGICPFRATHLLGDGWKECRECQAMLNQIAIQLASAGHA